MDFPRVFLLLFPGATIPEGESERVAGGPVEAVGVLCFEGFFSPFVSCADLLLFGLRTDYSVTLATEPVPLPGEELQALRVFGGEVKEGNIFVWMVRGIGEGGFPFGVFGIVARGLGKASECGMILA